MKKKIDCKNCKHKQAGLYSKGDWFRKNWQWCNIPKQFNLNGKCKYYKPKASVYS